MVDMNMLLITFFMLCTLSHVVDSFEPYLEIVEATVAVAVVVDGYTNLRIGHITHKLVALAMPTRLCPAKKFAV